MNADVSGAQRGLYLACLLTLAAMAGCRDVSTNRPFGAPCAALQDCGGGAVCARRSEGSDERICATIEMVEATDPDCQTVDCDFTITEGGDAQDADVSDNGSDEEHAGDAGPGTPPDDSDGGSSGAGNDSSSPSDAGTQQPPADGADAGTSGSDGSTAAADAEAATACNEGDTREGTTPCGLNGRGALSQVCDGGTWSDGANCEDPDLCNDGDTQVGTTPCGLNGRGTFFQVCEVGSWRDRSNCADPDICVDAATQAGTTACGLDGQGTLVLVCQGGEWVDSTWCDEPTGLENTDVLCSDGVSNDGDRFVDCDDYDCSRNPNVTVCESCSDAIDLAVEGTATDRGWSWRGFLTADTGSESGTCGGAGNELLFAFTPSESGDYVATTSGGIDTVVYARRTCNDQATEIACNDDHNDSVQSTMTLEDLVAGETYYLFADTFAENVSGPMGFDVSVVRGLGEGEACTPQDPALRCDDGYHCDPDLGRCVASPAPVLVDLEVFQLEDGTLRFVVEGSDEDANAGGLEVRLFDEAGEFVEVFPVTFDNLDEVYGATSFSGHKTLTPTGETEVFYASVELFDLHNNSSDVAYVYLPGIGGLPIRGEGDRCDPQAVRDRCEDGLSCASSDGTSMCRRFTAPRLDAVTVFVAGPATYHVAMDGFDADGDVIAYHLTFIDSEGRDVAVDTGGDANDDPATDIPALISVDGAVPDSTSFGPTTYSAQETLPVWLPIPDRATGLRVEFIDAKGFESNSVLAQWVDIPRPVLGESCDLDRFLSICADGLECRPQASVCGYP